MYWLVLSTVYRKVGQQVFMEHPLLCNAVLGMGRVSVQVGGGQSMGSMFIHVQLAARERAHGPKDA